MKKSSTKKIIETILILLLITLPIIAIYYINTKEYNYIYLFCSNLFIIGMLFIFYVLKYFDDEIYDKYIVISKEEYNNMKNKLNKKNKKLLK